MSETTNGAHPLTNPAGMPADLVGDDWMTATRRAEERAATDAASERTAGAEPEAPAGDADPFGFDRIAPSEWVGRAALLAAHLEIASRDDANANEVRQRARELEALLARARDGGFGTFLDAAVEQTEDELEAPLSPAAYAETPAVMIVPLAYPFEIEGQRFDRLEFRPPSFAMVERVMAGKAAEIDMQAEMAGVTPAVFRALRWSDAEAAIMAARHVAPALTARSA